MVVPLTGLGLMDGDYEIELAVNGSAIALSTLRLRSGDTPDAVNWATCTRLNYEIDHSQLGPCLPWRRWRTAASSLTGSTQLARVLAP